MRSKVNINVLKYLFLVFVSIKGLNANPTNQIIDGYWIGKKDPNQYETYLRIQNGSGFYCVLDDKNSFRFKLIGDSITTPMNGMNAIQYFPLSKDLQISGIEKGVTYTDIYGFTDSITYANKCRVEEAKIPVGVIVSKDKNQLYKRFLSKRISTVNILGKKNLRLPQNTTEGF